MTTFEQDVGEGDDDECGDKDNDFTISKFNPKHVLIYCYLTRTCTCVMLESLRLTISSDPH